MYGCNKDSNGIDQPQREWKVGISLLALTSSISSFVIKCIVLCYWLNFYASADFGGKYHGLLMLIWHYQDTKSSF